METQISFSNQENTHAKGLCNGMPCLSKLF